MNNKELLLLIGSLLGGAVGFLAVREIIILRKKIISLARHGMDTVEISNTLIDLLQEALVLIPEGEEKDALCQKSYEKAAFLQIKFNFNK